MLHLAGTEYTLKDRAFDIFVSGCTRYCEGCYNTELWDFNYGTIISRRVVFQLAEKIKDNIEMIETVRIMGGDLLCNDETSAFNFVRSLQELLMQEKIIWVLFTGAREDELPLWVRKKFDVIKVGKYIESLHDDSYHLASTNQYYIRKGVDY